MGVDLFFVLSGFLITGILLDTRDRAGYFTTFYIRRTLRTFPLYFGLLATAAVATACSSRLAVQAAPGFQATDNFQHAQAWLWTYTSNYRIARQGGFVPFNAGVLTFSHFWSLAIEEQFYLVWPLLVLICRRRWLLALSLLLALSSSLGRMIYVMRATWGPTSALTAYVWTPFRIDGLAIGAATAIMCRSPSRFTYFRQKTGFLLTAAALPLLAMQKTVGWDIGHKPVAAYGYSILAFAFACILTCCVTVDNGHPVRRVTELRPLRLLGKYSYSIYATHLIVLSVVLEPARNLLNPLLGNAAIVDLAARCTTGIIAIAVAGILWHWVEMPFLRLKRFFPNSTSKDLAAPIAFIDPALPR